MLIVANEFLEDGVERRLPLHQLAVILEHPVQECGFEVIQKEQFRYFSENFLHGVASCDSDGNAGVQHPVDLVGVVVLDVVASI